MIALPVRVPPLALVLALGVIFPLSAQTTSSEYRLKAVFLFNFTQFVDWPSTAFPDPQAPLIIGVLGVDPFGETLDEAVHGEVIRGHPLLIKRYTRVEEATACHILFISRSEAPRMPAILAALRGRPILTVGEAEDFAPQGGMIRFLTERNRIRLRVNLEAAKAGNLTISSTLLRSAEIVATRRQ